MGGNYNYAHTHTKFTLYWAYKDIWEFFFLRTYINVMLLAKAFIKFLHLDGPQKFLGYLLKVKFVVDLIG